MAIACLPKVQSLGANPVKTKTLRGRTLAAAVLVAFIPFAVLAQSSGGSAQMHESMMQGMKEMQSMKMSGDQDRDFAMMMKKHHEDGIKMAQIELDRGKDPKMKEMARKIIESQKKEAAEFEKWLQSRK